MNVNTHRLGSQFSVIASGDIMDVPSGENLLHFTIIYVKQSLLGKKRFF